ncbi:MAG TPA: DUF4118 domain-containing protein [Blastocatellia bacterium]|nr:DUF4118 domain-containing protein [Blastocatellia bacterium]
MELKRPAVLRYGLAIVAVLLITIVRFPINQALGSTSVPFLFYFLAITFAGWYGRFGPGLLATILSAAAARLFLIAPLYSFTLTKGDALRMFLFAVEGTVITLVNEGWHRSQGKRILSC